MTAESRQRTAVTKASRNSFRSVVAGLGIDGLGHIPHVSDGAKLYPVEIWISVPTKNRRPQAMRGCWNRIGNHAGMPSIHPQIMKSACTNSSGEGESNHFSRSIPQFGSGKTAKSACSCRSFLTTYSLALRSATACRSYAYRASRDLSAFRPDRALCRRQKSSRYEGLHVCCLPFARSHIRI